MGKNKKLNLGILSLLLVSVGGGILSTAETIEDAKRQINENNKIIGSEEGTTYTGEASNPFVTTKDGTKLEGKIKFDIKDTAANEAHLGLNGKGVKVDDLSITIAPKEGVTHTRSKGLITRGASDVNVKNLNVDITFKDSTGQFSGSADSNASYGVAVGYDWAGGNKTDTSRLTVNNMDVKVKNTPDTKISEKIASAGFLRATVYFGHQLSGLKVYRTEGAKAEFISNGNVNIEVKDLSTNKIGDYIVGAYVSGNESKAIFNGDTNIKIVANGKNSAAIKIGKPFENITGDGPTVTANGKLTIDTTEAKDSAAVRLFNNKAKFEITGENTEEASLINSGNTAISYDITDYELNYTAPFFGDLTASRNSNGEQQEVKLKNTVIKTNSETATLIEAKAADITDSSFGMASRFTNQLNSGAFSVNNAKFELSGEKSEAIAAKNGWLIEAMGNDTAFSSLTATIKDKALVNGLINKGGYSTLDMNLESGAKWVLKNKGDVNESTFNNLNIGENTILDASQFNLNSGEISPVPLSLTKNLEEIKKEIEEAEKWGRTPEPEVLENLKQAEEAIEEYKNNQDPKTIASQRAEFVLNSSSLDDKSKITNSGIITLDNGKYHDKLTLKGKYSSISGKLLVNTLWNEESGRNGENSESDLLEITGKVEGSTEVISIGSNNTLNQVDGEVGADEGDLGHRSAVVVKTPQDTPETAFVGKAKTENETELELKSEIRENNRVFFWEITKLGTKDIDIFLINNMDQSRNMFGRLNERRIKSYLFNSGREKRTPMTWARTFGSEYIYKNNDIKYLEGTLGLNVGIDVYTDYNKNNLAGFYFGYSNSTKKVGNSKSEKQIGRVKTDMFAFGFTDTFENKNFYADTVLQVAALKNRYNLNSKEISNTGVIVTSSLEAGVPVYFDSNKEKGIKYLVEPQLQLIYQFGKNSDVLSQGVKYGLGHSLTGRLGLRVGYATTNVNNKNGMGYALFNLWEEFVNTTKVSKGKKEFKPINSKVWIEAGFGANIPVTKRLSTYFEATAEKSIYGANKYGIKGVVGFNYER